MNKSVKYIIGLVILVALIILFQTLATTTSEYKAKNGGLSNASSTNSIATSTISTATSTTAR